MAEPIRRPAGWEDILAAPGDVKAEVLGGDLILHPRPLAPHGLTQAALTGELSRPYYRGIGGPGGWWFVIEPDVAFGAHDIVAPDLAGWRRERMPVLATERPVLLAPDWVCEVVSPSSARRDRIHKAGLYLSGGVPYYWLLDEGLRSLEAFEAQAGRWVRLGAWTDGDTASVPPFEAVQLEIACLFAVPPQPAP